MVRTRFAPSPTGYLHIGGVRTALFCWLFARRHGGQFILRIDDTDQQRNVEAALGPILHGFRWLGIDWDEGPEVGGPHGPYYQSKRLARYQQAAAELLARGCAYRDYATAEEIQAERDEATRHKRPFVYSRRWMAETGQQAAAFEAEGRKAVVRLKMPREGALVIDDQVRGRVTFDWAAEQDHVIQRADGTCLYHLASVVDDHDFGITHVIRAEEHLSNTPRQVFIAQSLGYALPVYAHLPFVAEPGSKTKLSKRKLDKYLKNKSFQAVHEHGMQIARRLGLHTAVETFNPVVVDFYEQVGYLSEALVNYLLLLGWSLDDKTEYFSREQMIEQFSLDRVVKSPASFDPDKLVSFQAHYMAELSVDQKLQRMLPYLIRGGLVESPVADAVRDKVRRIIEVLGDRLKVLGDIVLQADVFLLPDNQIDYDPKAFEQRLRAAGAERLLARFRDLLAEVEPFDAPTLEQAMRDFVAAEQIKIGDIVHAVRVATTGRATGAGLYDCLAILGRPSVLARIEQALDRV